MSDDTHFRAKIKGMSKQEKVEEFRRYMRLSGIVNLDVDRVMADQAAQGAPDSALDDALLRMAKIAGIAAGDTKMLTAKEMELHVRAAAKVQERKQFRPMAAHTLMPTASLFKRHRQPPEDKRSAEEVLEDQQVVALVNEIEHADDKK